MKSASSPDVQAERRSYEKPAIRPEMTVRQVANDYPPCREVFAEYGEPTDRPGRFGHFQPLTQFARDKEVCIDRLLQQLAEAADVPVDRHNQSAEKIHHGFILAALAITLTLGAGWGAWLLWKIGVHRDFEAVSSAHVVAHGEAQLWGFIGFFIAGVSLRSVLLDSARNRASQYICYGLLAVTLTSLAAGFAWSIAPQHLSAVGLVAAGFLLFVSLVLWGVQIHALRTKWPATWARAVILSGFWLTLWAGVTCSLRWQAGVVGPGSFGISARLLLIELAVFGFAMNSIYGFGQMLLPGFLRTGRTRVWAIETTFWLHNLGLGMIVANGFGFVSKIFAVVGIIAIASGAIFYAIGQHVFIGKQRNSNRPEQGHHLLDLYIPLAFLWLNLSLLMLLGGTLYEFVTETASPQAFIGAARHALTVGFMTTLILGVGQRLLPVFEHANLPLPGLVLPILILIAIGNLFRVVSELAAIWIPEAFVVMPFSAVLEWMALLLFAVNICLLFWRKDTLLKTGQVTPMSSLAVLLAEHPWLEDQLIEMGSTYLARARAVPGELTIQSFAESEGKLPEEFVGTINRLLKSHSESLEPA